MITLYELHWSHYCEKIRWALNFKKLDWQKINVNALTKKELTIFPRSEKGYLVPQIYDEKTQSYVGESTSILHYLEQTYPNSPHLFPESDADKKQTEKLLLEFDSKLAVIARRLGYTQIILEKPTILATLILSSTCKGVFNLPVIRNVTSAFLGMIIIKRYQCDLNESLSLYEELERYLLSLVDILKANQFLIGNQFTAADLSLAVYLRPLVIIPFFKENPQLAFLFQWRENIIKAYKGEDKLLYEELINEHRKKYSPVRRKIRKASQSDFIVTIDNQIKNHNQPYNDHDQIWTWKTFLVPYYYFFKISRNTVRQRFLSEKVR